MKEKSKRWKLEVTFSRDGNKPETVATLESHGKEQFSAKMDVSIIENHSPIPPEALQSIVLGALGKGSAFIQTKPDTEEEPS